MGKIWEMGESATISKHHSLFTCVLLHSITKPYSLCSGFSWNSSWSATRTAWRMLEIQGTCEDSRCLYLQPCKSTRPPCSASARTCSCTTTANMDGRSEGWTGQKGFTHILWYLKSRRYLQVKDGPLEAKLWLSLGKISLTASKSSSVRFQSGVSWSRAMQSEFRLHRDTFLE